jgi:hypothetical protein
MSQIWLEDPVIELKVIMLPSFDLFPPTSNTEMEKIKKKIDYIGDFGMAKWLALIAAMQEYGVKILHVPFFIKNYISLLSDLRL